MVLLFIISGSLFLRDPSFSLRFSIVELRLSKNPPPPLASRRPEIPFTGRKKASLPSSTFFFPLPAEDI